MLEQPMLMLKVIGVMVIVVVVVDGAMVELEDVGVQVVVEEADVQIEAPVIVKGKGDLEVVGEGKLRIVSY